jgi:phosphatidylinositol alpha-1,6-mannosyltransferase
VRVLFVSKPVVPPWNDGSKNLVRDVASHLVRARPTVMVSPGAAPLGGGIVEEAVYGETGTFAPSASANARVLARLMFGDPLDAWHFVFAPNPASSAAAWMAIRSRRARGWKGRVVQTIASVPRSFRGVGRLLFGDVVVAQSEHTRARLVDNGVAPALLRVVAPCAEAPRVCKPAELAEARRACGLEGAGPIVLYPGDYEVSTGASTVVAAARAIARDLPDARVVLACRRKTPRAERIEAELRESARDLGGLVRFLGDVPDMHALLTLADVVAMPVDDLYGKVDVPLVVIEALALGKPLVLSSGGPLESVHTANFVAPSDPQALAAACISALRGQARESALEGARLYAERFSPAVVAAAYDEIYREH